MTPITREDRLALMLALIPKVAADLVPVHLRKLEKILEEVEPRDESPQRGRRLAAEK